MLASFPIRRQPTMMAAERELLRWHDGICILFRSPRNKPQNETSFLATRLPAQPTVRFRLQRKKKKAEKGMYHRRIEVHFKQFKNQRKTRTVYQWVTIPYYKLGKDCLLPGVQARISEGVIHEFTVPSAKPGKKHLKATLCWRLKRYYISMITLSFWSIIRLHPLYVFSTYFSEKKNRLNRFVIIWSW